MKEFASHSFALQYVVCRFAAVASGLVFVYSGNWAAFVFTFAFWEISKYADEMMNVEIQKWMDERMGRRK